MAFQEKNENLQKKHDIIVGKENMIFEQTLEETIFIQGIVNKQDWSNGKKE